jgi:hypothetical protein
MRNQVPYVSKTCWLKSPLACCKPILKALKVSESESSVEVVGLRRVSIAFGTNQGEQLFRVPVQNHLARCEEMVLRLAGHTTTPLRILALRKGLLGGALEARRGSARQGEQE